MTETQAEYLAVKITKLFIPLDVPDTLGSINFAEKAAEVAGILIDAPGTAELLTPPEEFFRRAIDTRLACTDGSEEVTLDCGHTIVRIIPLPGDSMDCPECVNEFVKEHRDRECQP